MPLASGLPQTTIRPIYDSSPSHLVAHTFFLAFVA